MRKQTGCIGLVLPGGGARGAYQVGVLKAIAELSPREESPFDVLTGVSVGAINCASLATHASAFKPGVTRLVELWAGLHAARVYRAGFFTVARTGLHWLLALTFGGLGIANPRCLLDNEPLARLLNDELDLDKIDDAIADGALQAIAVTASSYATNRAVTFFQGADDVPEWSRIRRDGVRARLRIDHLMASTALPLIFAARRIDNEYFGDGSLRLTAPLSPAIRLGADRLLVIGVRDESRDPAPQDPGDTRYPSLGDLGGHMLDVLFSDDLDADIERLLRVNQTLSLMRTEARAETRLRDIQTMVIRPSKDIREISRRHADALPWPTRMLMRGLGVWATGTLPSFLLFERPFCEELIQLGYRDAMDRRDDLVGFLDLN